MFKARIMAAILIVSMGWAISARGDCPTGDLNGDCIVDLVDLGFFAFQWLDIPGGSANLDGTPGVTFGDFAVLASQWRTRGEPVTLVINEFMADNNCFFFDSAGDDDDWIEIYNYGPEPVDLGGMFVTDDLDEPTKCQIPMGMRAETTVPAGGFLILWADNEELPEDPLHLSFALAAGGDEDIALFDRNGRLVDSILNYGPQEENASYGRMPDAGEQWQVFAATSQTPPTPGQNNGGRPPEDEILITEIMYHPFNAAHPLVEDIGEEYIEIHNPGPAAVSLAGWRFTDGVDFTFPAVTIGPGQYLVVASDTVKFAAKYPNVTNVVGGWDGRLSNSGETIELTNAAGRVIDRITYADQGEWARRILGPVDNGHRGWTWADDHDGDGKSLELISLSMPNEYGQNWAASIADHGSPGAANAATGVFPQTVALVTTGSIWRYLDDGSDQGVAWRAVDFDDSAWLSGSSQLGYGGDGEATTVGYGPDEGNKYITTYFRHRLDIPDVTQFVGFKLRILRDDGAVIYINGEEFQRTNMPLLGDINYLTRASSNLTGAAEDTFHEFIVDPGKLRNGTNVLAVEVHQVLPSSADISFDLILEGALRPAGEPTRDIAPMIVDAEHRPAIPRSTDPVTVTARIIDEQAVGLTVSLRYRADGQPVFETAGMTDDGLNGDEIAGDGIFTGQIPPQADDTVVEFYIEATDAAGNTRMWPAPVDVDGVLQQRCNGIYLVDDDFDQAAAAQPGAQPFYHIIMTEVQRAELDRIGSTSGEANSDAQMHATFISIDGVDTKVRYSVGVRNRGHGSRTRRPNNYRVNFPTDRPWKDVTAINLNTQYTWVQLAGSAIFQRSGLPIGDARAVQVRVNGRNLANSGPPQYGSYVHVEAVNSEYADRQFPGNGAGNIYKCMREGSEADLRYEGPDSAPYRVHYFKETNESQDDWSDLIDLTYTLSGNTPDDIYVEEVNRVVNVEQWLRFLALNVLLDNSETTLANGDGDDYFLYRGDVDTRFVLMQHDLDSIFGQGQSIGSATAEIFPFMSGAGGESPVEALRRMVNHPHFAPRYYAQLKDLIETVLSPEQLDPFLDNLLGGFVPQSTIDAMKSWQAARNAYVLYLIPSDLTVESTLPQVGGYHQTTASEVALSGSADPARTRSITVNGAPESVQWSAVDGRWSIGTGSGGTRQEVIVTRGSAWRYLDDGSNQGIGWTALEFDDSAWRGPQHARLGYGGDGETQPPVGYVDTDPDASGTQKNITTYFRRVFTVEDPSKYSRLGIGLLRDDGAAVYLNGNLLFTSNLSTTPLTYTTRADNTVSSSDEDTFYNYVVENTLIQGDNVLAVEIHQINNTSSDLAFDLEMVGIIEDSSPVTGVPLLPGINRIIVRAFDGPAGTGRQIGQTHIDVWRNNTTGLELSGTLTQDTTLSAASGPFTVTADLTVPAGVTLTIEPGTTLFFAAGTALNVNGRLLAEGAEYRRICFTRIPGGGNWDGIRFEYPQESPPRPTALRQNNRISYADMEYCDAAGHAIRAIYANVDLENVSFERSNDMHLDFSDSSILARNCSFCSLTGSELIHFWGFPDDGYALFEGNVFGTTTGYNDIIDLTGGKLPGPISRFINNVFLGGGDDGIDLDAADSWVEGNIIMHFHQDAPRESLSHAISTGTEYGEVSNIAVVRNLIYDVDHAFLIKDGAYAWIENNTVVDASIAVANFFEDRPGQWPAVGASFDGNIFHRVGAPFVNLDAQGTVTDLAVNRSIIPDADLWPGVGNFTADPLLARSTDVTDPRIDFVLRGGSPALGAGPNGLDMGALVPAGPSITGEPGPVTNKTHATLTIDGPGITHYRYKLNDGPWGAETPIDTPVTLTGLSDGTYTVSVIGKNFAGIWQDAADAAVSDPWTVDSTWSRLVISEVLAHNTSLANTDGTLPDMVELRWDGPTSLDLSGMSLTDNPDNPSRFIFPDGTMIDSGQHLVLYADDVLIAGQIHLGFALDDRGDAVCLYDADRTLIDSVQFGMQVPGLSIARDAAGQWKLAMPTFGGENVFQPLGPRDGICINEWLTHGHVSFVDDFVEFYNPSDRPVDLGGLYITDHAWQPEKHQIAPLSFIAARGYAVLDTGSRPNQGRLPFRLSADQGVIALFESDTREIDWVIYGPQVADVSQGRRFDGDAVYAFFDIPTPGAQNAAAPITETLQLKLLDITQEWSYDQSDTPLPNQWRQNDYDDTLWPRGSALLYVEGSSLPAPKNTPLSLGADTYYFRTHFTIDPAIDVADIVRLEFAMVLDDAAVVWINGAEVLRPGFNSDTVVEHTTRADRSVSNAVYEYASVDGDDVILYPGDNVIAVEVHQVEAGSSDIVFGLAMDAAIQRTQQVEDPLVNARRIMQNLRVTELMYHAAMGANLDFIELQNIGVEDLDVTGVRFDEGISFTFPEMTLAPGAYVVVAADAAAFAAHYGTEINAAGEFSGGLSNRGENVVLRLPHPLDAAVLRIEYSAAWYPTTDGEGLSLIIRDVTADRAEWNKAAGWTAGSVMNGTPGAPN
ncbi:MAG TPA: lamin tail domain-containing protein [Anaerohalosphaeraceae bacterium]|nr:lamin tail domain-containing protein [Anaerohalosphaeraceae bacterium]HRT51554.1 lamin tail domain-containing protein [Anaerohalosphaeraceae bacterium]HRT87571.1 lamin tail domain-containing protein [Anaerohalosphaeraceae bacterium]